MSTLDTLYREAWRRTNSS